MFICKTRHISIFIKKQFDDAITDLSRIFETDSQLLYKIKVQLLKCYYELSESNAFYSLCTSFSALLGNKNKYPSRVSELNNFIKITKKLFKVKEGFSKKTLTFFEDELQHTKPMAEISRLMEMLDELR